MNDKLTVSREVILHFRTFDPPHRQTPGTMETLVDSDSEDVPLPPADVDAGIVLHQAAVDEGPEIENFGEYQIVRGASQRGHNLLIGPDQRTYNVSRRTDTCTTWQCTVRPKGAARCGAKVYQNFSLDGTSQFNTSRAAHKCVADKQRSAATLVIMKNAKAAAKQNLAVSARRLLKDAESSYSGGDHERYAFKDQRLAANSINRHRQKLRPVEPKTTVVNYDETFRPGFKIATVNTDGQNAYVFSTRLQLEYLARCQTWYGDGTFKLVGKPFYQLWSLNGHVRKAGPRVRLGADEKIHTAFVYAIMSGKGKSSYREIVTAVLRRMAELNLAPRVKHVVLDFEKAEWIGIEEAFTQCGLQLPRLRGCVFHWTQAVFRKITNVGLAQSYKRRDDRGRFLRRLISLPLMPPQSVQELATWFHDNAPSGAYKKVTQYILDTYVSDGALFKPMQWSGYRTVHRTNNSIEGFHHKLNLMGTSKLKFYRLVSLLYENAQHFKADVAHVQEGHLRQKLSKKTKAINVKLTRAWDAHAQGEIDDFELLLRCNVAYRPQ